MAVILSQITIDQQKLLIVDGIPSTGAGTVASIGDLAIVSGLAGFFQKTASADIAWTEVSDIEIFNTITSAVTYLANGNIDFIEWFNSATQITANRIRRTDFTYNADLTPATEILKEYIAGGTTIRKTITYTYTYTNGDLTSYSRAVS